MRAMHLRRSEPVSTTRGLGSLYDLLRLEEHFDLANEGSNGE